MIIPALIEDAQEQAVRNQSLVSLKPERKRVNVPKAIAEKPTRKPKLGQHFLADDEAAERIVEALGDLTRATVLEIGPGRGALTEMLARRAQRLIAVEPAPGM